MLSADKIEAALREVAIRFGGLSLHVNYTNSRHGDEQPVHALGTGRSFTTVAEALFEELNRAQLARPTQHAGGSNPNPPPTRRRPRRANDKRLR